MKIGILTFHCAHNYGAVLQCYGLQEYLKSLGHDVHVIDYRPKYITSQRDYLRFSPKVLITKQLKYLPSVFWSGVKLARKRNNRWSAFQKFINSEFNLFKADSSFRGEGFDLCIVGSDQIWNEWITGGKFEPLYFGEGFSCPVISYAASSMVEKLEAESIQTLRTLLSNLSAISVREAKLSSQLSEVISMAPPVVIDPTFLAGMEAFLPLANADKYTSLKDYLLVYTIHENEGLQTIAKRIAREKNLKLIEIASDFSLKRYKRKIYDTSVSEFVTLFKNASFVVTSSFHGLAFSLLFEKNFYAVRSNTEVDVRLAQVLGRIGWLDRFVQPDSNVSFSNIDYSEVRDKLMSYRDVSVKFLHNAIECCGLTHNTNPSSDFQVSVIMPVYNAAHYLSDAINSILRQESIEFELILVDDGSTDESLNICKRYVRGNKHIKLIHQPNQGVSAARNRGLREARGEYVIFVDSDDMLLPEALSTLYSVAKENKYIHFVQGAHNILSGGG